jgi:hypothetical protein
VGDLAPACWRDGRGSETLAAVVDSEARRAPLLTRPFEAGMTGWIVVLGAILAELIGGSVTNHMSTPVVGIVLGIPVVVVLGFAVAQWSQMRSSGLAPTHWWHFAGIAAALLAWWVWPTRPGVLDGTGNAVSVCQALAANGSTTCLPRAAQAVDGHDIAWWGTAVLILLMALLVRRSRIAAWAAIPVAFAGVEFATHFMEQLLLLFNAGG